MCRKKPFKSVIVCGCLLVLLAACAPAAGQIIPTPRPSEAPTDTPAPSPTSDAPPTPAPQLGQLAGGASPTPLFGPTMTPLPGQPTPTRVLNPNAPRVEFFQSAGPVEPGDTLTLLWSTRNTERVVIYQLNRQGERDRAWNVEPSGRQAVRTNATDRGALDFVIVVGLGDQQVEQRVTVPLICTVAWFFNPPPAECPDIAAEETLLIEQRFERGRLFYVGSENRIYALFNDDETPAWIRFDNRFDPNVNPDSEPGFNPPPGLYQPVGRLGFLWRGNDTVRRRLGLGIEPEVSFQGVLQRATLFGGAAALYLTSPDGTVVQITGTGSSWQIITPN